jgi:hypothetical protein
LDFFSDSIESQIVHDIVFTETIQVFDKLVNEKQRQHKDLLKYESLSRNDTFFSTEFCFQSHGKFGKILYAAIDNLSFYYKGILITVVFFLVGQIISISVFETFVYMERRKNQQGRR